MNEVATAQERTKKAQRLQVEYKRERGIAKAAGYEHPNDYPGRGEIKCLVCGGPVVQHPLTGAHPEVMSDRPTGGRKRRDRD